MDEATSVGKAIPLRRSRASARAGAAPPSGWTDTVAGGMRYALEPTRQVWLASLGGTAIALRGARAAWLLLVSEGTAAEAWLQRSLGNGQKPEAAAG